MYSLNTFLIQMKFLFLTNLTLERCDSGRQGFLLTPVGRKEKYFFYLFEKYKSFIIVIPI